MDFYRNASAKFHCAMVNTETGKWFRGSCMKPIPFICNGGGSGHSNVARNSKLGYTSRIKLGLKTDANLNKAVVQSQILHQIRAKLEEHGLSDFALRWTQMEGKSLEEGVEEEEEC
uniref:Uncharacterized protein n=1 Tax=Knipowitschia caucasica TaxID=637954 RepID=A0AAV2K5R6_KNICA